jgi:hypothetical protein
VKETLKNLAMMFAIPMALSIAIFILGWFLGVCCDIFMAGWRLA